MLLTGLEADGRTIVSSHIDVVPPHIPYSISGNTIYGRGSNDAKGSVATQIQAVEELRKAGKVSDGDVAMLFVVGEEVNPFPESLLNSSPNLLILHMLLDGVYGRSTESEWRKRMIWGFNCLDTSSSVNQLN
jgi:hypothetical protein